MGFLWFSYCFYVLWKGDAEASQQCWHVTVLLGRSFTPSRSAEHAPLDFSGYCLPSRHWAPLVTYIIHIFFIDTFFFHRVFFSLLSTLCGFLDYLKDLCSLGFTDFIFRCFSWFKHYCFVYDFGWVHYLSLLFHFVSRRVPSDTLGCWSFLVQFYMDMLIYLLYDLG